jgi:hypothetical protein
MISTPSAIREDLENIYIRSYVSLIKICDVFENKKNQTGERAQDDDAEHSSKRD